MTDYERFLKNIVDALELEGIHYMVAGSIGTSFYGEPRATNDVDIIVAASSKSLARLTARLEQNYYVDSLAAQEALAEESMFNVVDAETGTKADLIFRKTRDFSIEEFGRRRIVTFGEIKLAIMSPEDAILSKLEWSIKGDTERQYRDALGVIRVNREELDWDYLRKWAKVLGVDELLRRIEAD